MHAIYLRGVPAEAVAVLLTAFATLIYKPPDAYASSAFICSDPHCEQKQDCEALGAMRNKRA
jgi:hypothetical protein